MAPDRAGFLSARSARRPAGRIRERIQAERDCGTVALVKIRRDPSGDGNRFGGLFAGFQPASLSATGFSRWTKSFLYNFFQPDFSRLPLQYEPPQLAESCRSYQFLKRTRDINQNKRTKALQWQRGLGVVNFGLKQLKWVQEYIANQKEHHASGNVFDRPERTEFDEEEAG